MVRGISNWYGVIRVMKATRNQPTIDPRPEGGFESNSTIGTRSGAPESGQVTDITSLPNNTQAVEARGRGRIN